MCKTGAADKESNNAVTVGRKIITSGAILKSCITAFCMVASCLKIGNLLPVSYVHIASITLEDILRKSFVDVTTFIS